MATTERIQALADWLADRPRIHELAIAWPPQAKVMARDGVRLMIPAPGVEGVISSYFEGGNVGVVAPMADTITSPITEITLVQGEMMSGECDPALLELVGYGEYTPDDVRAALRHNAMWEDGTTADGHRIEIDIDPYTAMWEGHDVVAKVDGERVGVGHVDRQRDGGTTILYTTIGTITCPRRLGSDDRTPRLRLYSL